MVAARLNRQCVGRSLKSATERFTHKTAGLDADFVGRQADICAGATHVACGVEVEVFGAGVTDVPVAVDREVSPSVERDVARRRFGIDVGRHRQVSGGIGPLLANHQVTRGDSVEFVVVQAQCAARSGGRPRVVAADVDLNALALVLDGHNARARVDGGGGG